MMLFVTSLLFSGLLMTHGDQITDDMSVSPLSDPVYVFDVRTDAPVSDVKAALSGVTLRHSFKIIGERRYIFVVISNSTEALRDLDFPAGSVVTQYPAGHFSDLLKIFGVSSGWDESYDAADYFDDTVFMFADWRLTFPDDVTAEEYKTVMYEFGQNMVVVHDFIKKFVMYSVVASYPPRVLIFASLEDNAVNTLLARDVEAHFGGPASMTHDMTHVVKI